MKYLQIIKQMERHETAQPDHAPSLRNEIDEIDEIGCADQGVNSSISSNSFASDESRDNGSGDAATATLRYWYGSGTLDTLPDRIPAFTGHLAHYSDRARLIGMVRAILAAVPWSLTAQDRAVQFVTILTPLIDSRAGGVATPEGKSGA